MKTGIIGLPQVGKTSLFRMLTKVNLSDQAYSNPREAHIGVAKVPDERLDKLAALYHPKKLTHASVGSTRSFTFSGRLKAMRFRTSAPSTPCATSRTLNSISWLATWAR